MTSRLLVVAMLAGCHGSTPAPLGEVLPASAAGIDRAVFVEEVDTLIELASRACACADDACFHAVDDDLVSYARRATPDDPVTEVEAWPADLDALGQSQFVRLVACMADHHQVAYGLGVFDARAMGALRDAGCACADVPCAVRIQARLHAEETRGHFATNEAIEAERDDAASELHQCLQGPLGEQGVLDMKKLRAAACACEDEACAAGVRARTLAWADANGQWIVTPAAEREMLEIAGELRACLTAP